MGFDSLQADLYKNWKRHHNFTPGRGFQNIFDLDPDKIFESRTGTNIYQSKAKIMKYPQTWSELMNNTGIIGEDYVDPQEITAINETWAEKPGNATETSRKQSFINTVKAQINNLETAFVNHTWYKNTTQESLKMKRILMKMDDIINEPHFRMPSFDSEEDELTVETRRFDGLLDEMKVLKTRRALQTRTADGRPKTILTRREDYWIYNGRTWWELNMPKYKLFSLIEQFIYETRYKLPYVQKLRKKYKDSFKYRFGYLFSFLKELDYKMAWIHTIIARYYAEWVAFPTYNYHIQLLETMVRYDLDVGDVVNYIKKLEYERKMFHDPEYYDYFPY